MSAGEPALFSDLALRVDGRPEEPVRDRLLQLYRNGFSRLRRVSVQAGPSQRRERVTVRELLRRWSGGRAVISVTDLHIRGTRVEPAIGIAALSDFNVLLLGSEDMALQEMMTLVISSAGNVTDSHSDDPDGSNHCFAGTKLWLAWDTFEGLHRGLQDNSRQELHDSARFDMRVFLELPSSRWWLVTEGETLFLPGKLTHKVITLEHYLGIGSFYVALPNALQTVMRWYDHGPLWSLTNAESRGLIDEIALAAARKADQLRIGSNLERRRWGIAYLRGALERFEQEPAPVRAALLRNAAFAELCRAAARVGPGEPSLLSAAS